MIISLGREKNHCRAGEPHANDYFAGACDGITGRATPDIHGEDIFSVAAKDKSDALGKLTIHFVNDNTSVDIRSANLSNVAQDEAQAFIDEVEENQRKCATLSSVTVTNEQGSYLSVKTGQIFMVVFEIYVQS